MQGYRLDINEYDSLNVNVYDIGTLVDETMVYDVDFTAKFLNITDGSNTTSVKYNLYKKNAKGEYVLYQPSAEGIMKLYMQLFADDTVSILEQGAETPVVQNVISTYDFYDGEISHRLWRYKDNTDTALITMTINGLQATIGAVSITTENNNITDISLYPRLRTAALICWLSAKMQTSL